MTEFKKYIFPFFLFFIFIPCLGLLPLGASESESAQNRYKILADLSKKLPEKFAEKINKNKQVFLKELNELLSSEKDNLLILVDKKHILDKGYKPKTIILLSDLKNRAYKLDRPDIFLSETAEPALQKMALAARKAGIRLTVSSGYREYEYQSNLFNYYIKVYGKLKAKTFSAPPGSSQHQLGTAVDFGTIDDSYAKTPEGKWLAANAYKYGWSLSYPKDYENITGYKWECWHYRYIGEKACGFQKKWFGDIQYYMLFFIDEWKKADIKK